MTTAGLKVGVLALQGAFREHRYALERCGAQVTNVRLPQDLSAISGLIIPGGESTTMAKLLIHYGFDKALPDFHARGAAIWGTCAGAILLAKSIKDYPEQFSLGLMDIAVDRNAYGRQVASFERHIAITNFNDAFNAIFIRAPKILGVSEGVKVLAQLDGDPILVQQGRLMASVFHPELEQDDRIHQYFLHQLQTDHA